MADKGHVRGVTLVASCTSASGPPPPLPNFSSIKGVLFDIDGTLTNSDPLHLLAFQQVLAAAGFNGGAPIDEDFFRRRISGRHNPEIAADLFPEWDEAVRVGMYTEKEALFRQLAASQLQPMPGLHDFLGWVDAKGLRKAAVTNAPRANTEMMLAALHLDTYFEAVVLGEECSRPKPYPDPYQDGLRALGLAAQQAIALEDSPSGLRAAVAAGIPTIGITSGQSAETLLAAGACAVVGDFNDLMALIHGQQQAQAAVAAPAAGEAAGVAA